MKIIRKFARWVLRRDFEIFDICIKNLRKEIEDKDGRIEMLRKRIEYWEYNSTINPVSILPVSAVKAILDCLPNPNYFSVQTIKNKHSTFSHNLRGKKIEHLVRLDMLDERKGEMVAGIRIDDLKTTIIFPLRKQSVNYSICGVGSQVETWYWDFNFSNIKVIPDEIFDMIAEFSFSQKNVIQEFKKDGLL